MKAKQAAIALLLALPSPAAAEGYLFVHPRDKSYHFVRVSNADQPCDPSRPTVCTPPSAADLDCTRIEHASFAVRGGDPHRFDAYRDGIGCERTR